MCVSFFQHPLMLRRGHASDVLARLHHKSSTPHYRTAPVSTALNYAVCAYRSPPLTPASCDGHYINNFYYDYTNIVLIVSIQNDSTEPSLRTRPPLLVLQVLPVWQTGGVGERGGEPVRGSMERRLPSGSRPRIPGGYGNYLTPDLDSPTPSQETSQSQSQRRRAPGPWGGHFQGQVCSSSALLLLPLILLQYSTLKLSHIETPQWRRIITPKA